MSYVHSSPRPLAALDLFLPAHLVLVPIWDPSGTITLESLLTIQSSGDLRWPVGFEHLGFFQLWKPQQERNKRKACCRALLASRAESPCLPGCSFLVSTVLKAAFKQHIHVLSAFSVLTLSRVTTALSYTVAIPIPPRRKPRPKSQRRAWSPGHLTYLRTASRDRSGAGL